MFNSNEKELYSQIKLLELKIKVIQTTKDYLEIIKPSFFYIKERKKWNTRFKKLLKEEKETYKKLDIKYKKIEKILSFE